MPKKPVDYSTTHFYKIVCKDLNNPNMYIGHTTSFKERKSGHRKRCNNPNDKKYNFPVYKFIRDNNGFDNLDMILIETKQLNNQLEALARERELYEELRPSLNGYKTMRNDDDIRESAKQKCEYKKNDRKENQEKYKEIDRNKYIKHREEAVQRAKVHYETHKDEISTRKREQGKHRVVCECRIECSINWILRHKKTKLHQDYLKSSQPEETTEQ